MHVFGFGSWRSLGMGVGAAVGLIAGIGAAAASQDHQDTTVKSPAAFIADVCQRIDAAANAHALPPGFLARLIWQESRFNPDAVSPKGASGIAQFTAATARDRGLDDPFDPRSAIPASAHYLADLKAEFGNLGLAAAAYNAGPARLDGWLADKKPLPGETRHFVRVITGFSASEWRHSPPAGADFRLDQQLAFQPACNALPVRHLPPKPDVDYVQADWQPWGVHLAAAWSPGRALSQYARLKRQFPDLLGGRTPLVLRITRHARGRAPRFAVRLGQPNRAKARALCQEFQEAGGICIVTRNTR